MEEDGVQSEVRPPGDEGEVAVWFGRPSFEVEAAVAAVRAVLLATEKEVKKNVS